MDIQNIVDKQFHASIDPALRILLNTGEDTRQLIQQQLNKYEYSSHMWVVMQKVGD